MESLSEHKVYEIQKGRVLDEDDPPVKDVTKVGLQSLTEGTTNPLMDYNKNFIKLQEKRKKKPVIIPSNDSTTMASSSPAPNPTTSPPASLETLSTSSPAPLTRGPPSHPVPPSEIAAVTREDDEESNEDRSEWSGLLSALEEHEPTLTLSNPGDVALDMDIAEGYDGPDSLSEGDDDE
jgi:hypothetical protein